VNYKKLFQLKEITHVGLIGTGAFGRSFLAQARRIPGIQVPVVCDQDLEVAEDACRQAGMASEDLKICHTGPDANDVIAAGNKLKRTVDKGELLTYGMIDHDGQSGLWKLRREQDELFEM
jgi:predicted homoserine dehydrogenase-like protein